MKKRFRLIIIAFTVSFAVMASLSIYSIKQFSSLNAYSEQVDHANNVITLLYKIESGIKEYDIQERGFMISHDSVYIRQLFQITSAVNTDIRALDNLIKEDEAQHNELVKLKGALSMRTATIKDNFAHTDTAGGRISAAYAEGNKIKQECLRYIKNMLQREKGMLHERFESKLHYQQTTSQTITYLLIIFCAATIILFFIIISELKKRIASQEELQTKLIDLKRSHAELEQIAFAASHHLQEPLRKIRVFANRLLWLVKEKPENAVEESAATVDRINAAAERMQELIDDMGYLTGLIKEDAEKETVDLNNIVKVVLEELDDKIQASSAVIHREVLPDINGYQRQLHILFKAMLDNSLKFRRAETPPVVAIRYDKVAGDELTNFNQELANKVFHRITISDNGIGFDNKFISKMFKLFQRLHADNTEYEGKGIGLAICQRIVVNHEGYILAYGHPNTGATFKLFFPLDN